MPPPCFGGIRCFTTRTPFGVERLFIETLLPEEDDAAAPPDRPSSKRAGPPAFPSKRLLLVAAGVVICEQVPRAVARVARDRARQ